MGMLTRRFPLSISSAASPVGQISEVPCGTTIAISPFLRITSMVLTSHQRPPSVKAHLARSVPTMALSNVRISGNDIRRPMSLNNDNDHCENAFVVVMSSKCGAVKIYKL